MDSARSAAIADFLAAAGWGQAARAPLAGDASARRYERLTRGDETAVLMDAPPGSGAQTGDETDAFVRIARHLLSLGLSAPRILAEDLGTGLLLLEDLGDGLYSRLVAADPSREVALYEAAAGAIAVMAKGPCPEGLPILDATSAPPQIAPFLEFYVPATGTDVAAGPLMEALSEAIDRQGGPADVMIHRDYHAENLLWLPDRKGVARVGIIDFQLAHRGAAAYDLVSLVEDARRNVGEAARTAAIRHYCGQMGLSETVLAAAMAVWGAQRNLRILGIFARLATRLGKPQYADLIPRTWGHLNRDLAHPALAAVARFALPPPTPTLLERLKSPCTAPPGP